MFKSDQFAVNAVSIRVCARSVHVTCTCTRTIPYRVSRILDRMLLMHVLIANTQGINLKLEYVLS